MEGENCAAGSGANAVASATAVARSLAKAFARAIATASNNNANATAAAEAEAIEVSSRPAVSNKNAATLGSRAQGGPAGAGPCLLGVRDHVAQQTAVPQFGIPFRLPVSTLPTQGLSVP